MYQLHPALTYAVVQERQRELRGATSEWSRESRRQRRRVRQT